MNAIDKLIAGYHRFRSGYFLQHRQQFETLANQGQSPAVAVVGCCDSRVDPAIITDSPPGEMFVIRNVANLVPPCEGEGTWHGTSAALEFAVRGLKVQHIVVLGHARCGGIRALMTGENGTGERDRFISKWMEIAHRARETALSPTLELDFEQRLRLCEQEGVRTSLDNLLTFPWIRKRVESGQLALHGWYFDVATGELQALDGQSGRFQPL